MDTNNRMSESAMQVLYKQRINGLGECLMLCANLYSEFGSLNPWHYTEPSVDRLMPLIAEMAELAFQVDEEYAEFWLQMKLILLKAR